MKQHGRNLGKCACVGSALGDAVLWDSSILGLSSSTRPGYVHTYNTCAGRFTDEKSLALWSLTTIEWQ
jgi:hypothetical protein